jgi:hypothetical protein
MVKKREKKNSKKRRSRSAERQATSAPVPGRTCAVCGTIELRSNRCPTCGAETVTAPWMEREARLLRLTGTVGAAGRDSATESLGEGSPPGFELVLESGLRLRVDATTETRILCAPGIDPSQRPEPGCSAEILCEVHEVFDEPAGLREAPRRRLLARAAMLALGPGCAAELSRALEALQTPEPQRELVVAEEAPRTGSTPARTESDSTNARPMPGWVGFFGFLETHVFAKFALILLLLSYPLLLLVADCAGLHRLSMMLEKTRWRLGAAALVESNPPALLIQMHSSSSRGSRYRLVTLSTQDGRRLGERLDRHGPLDFLAVTSDGLWSNRTAGYRLPWLGDHPAVRPARQTDEWKRCDQKPPALLESRRCSPLMVGDDAVRLDRSARGQTLSRRSRSGAPRWERAAKEFFHAENRPIRFATLHAGRLYLIAEEGEGKVDDLYVVALDARDGSTAWSHVFW